MTGPALGFLGRLRAREIRDGVSMPVLAALPIAVWCGYDLLNGQYRRWDLWAILIVVPALAYAGKSSRRFLLDTYPLLLVGALYDMMRFVQDVGLTPARIHVRDMYELDRDVFGITEGGTRMAPQDWFQAHSSPALDLLAAVPYGTYIFVAIGYAAWLFFKDREGLRRYAWTFFLLNVLGFLTYHLFPAAPPWYFHRFGSQVHLDASASEGPNLARVDEWLGFGYFRGLYGRSHDVFGAMPSLHVTYPLLIIMEGWKRHRWLGRIAAIAFWIAMCFAAVYLDHHWVSDVLAGLLYVVSTYVLVTLLLRLMRTSNRARAGEAGGADCAAHQRRAVSNQVDQRPAPQNGRDDRELRQEGGEKWQYRCEEQ